jgi:hypothetical protein
VDPADQEAIEYWCGLSPSQQKRQFYLELKRHCLDKRYRPGWTACMYKERFGVWPPDGAERLRPAVDVSIVVLQWLAERNKRFFVAKNARERIRGR